MKCYPDLYLGCLLVATAAWLGFSGTAQIAIQIVLATAMHLLTHCN